MNRIAVNSKGLKSVGYNPKIHLLEIEFKEGMIKQFFGVPKSKFEGLMDSPTKDLFFDQDIRENFATAELVQS